MRRRTALASSPRPRHENGRRAGRRLSVHAATRTAIEATWRIESARIVGALARLLGGDLGLAEEFAQDALVAALEHWPRRGVPDNPGAWLMATARNRALDRQRRHRLASGKLAELEADMEATGAVVVPDATDDLDARAGVVDDVLRLVFTACHPVLGEDARVALTLKVVVGLTTHEIARAFLVSEPTIAQRLVRARRTLREAAVPFELPSADALGERLASVLEVLYLIFNEGYSATAGSEWMRPDLAAEALRLGRMLASHAPAEAEVHGLAALMELQAARMPARADAEGRPILLADQDRSRWDRLLIRRGLVALTRAERLAARPGFYQLQAAIAACHVRAPSTRATDWPEIARLYGVLGDLAPSPVIQLNRAVAISMAEGPVAALELIDTIQDQRALGRYPWLPAVRGDLLARLGRHDEARREFLRAADLAGNEREAELMRTRASASAAAALASAADGH
ncbi:MAG: RNA polymerase sigma factor [Xanthomonadales bacterium]|nr:RNA polymerase sigma factor [Xanthomonadales bacterium]